MAKFIGIFNNKGGVGKTTLSLFISDFLSSITINKKKSRVLVIDFDPQASCSNAMLGIEKVARIKSKELTLPHAITNRFNKNSVELIDYIFTREENVKFKTRKVKLGSCDVISSSHELVVEYEEISSIEESLETAKWMKSQLTEKYDFVFVDLPGNISRRNGFSLIGAFLVDYFIIPTELNRININSIQLTLDILDNIKNWRGEKNKCKLLGFVLNKADKRTKQYKLHKDELAQFSNRASCKIFDNILPPTPKIADATDDSIEYFTLSDRYDTYYNSVRKLVIEIVKELGYSLSINKNKVS